MPSYPQEMPGRRARAAWLGCLLLLSCAQGNEADDIGGPHDTGARADVNVTPDGATDATDTADSVSLDGTTDSPTPVDVSTETADTLLADVPDAPLDGADVVTIDSGVDSGSDTGSDTGTDTGSDTGSIDSGTDAGSDSGVTTATWSTNAVDHRCLIGSKFSYACPAGGTAGSIWGTGEYTDDSSVCTAAVHSGRITLSGGGTITIEMRAGRSSYTSSTAYGITSGSYGSWTCSFAVDPAPGDGGVDSGSDTGSDSGGDSGVTIATWTTNASAHRCVVGSIWSYACPAGGTASSIWGTTEYTDDSSICTAAVHAGKITLSAGGTVTIEMRTGASSYTGSTAFGITSGSWGSWLCGFAFK